MSSTDRTYLEKLRAHAVDTRKFLGNKMKPERERSVCRAFLRAIGVSFVDGELLAPTVEPADVAFRDARFQVRDLLREHRRGDVWRRNEKRYAEAQSLTDLLKPYSPPVSTSIKDLLPEVATALAEKAAKYGAGCKGLDALMYVDLQDIYLEANSVAVNTAELQHQGWRSVSLFFAPYGFVLFANDHAPAFLRNVAGRAQMKWANTQTLFET